MLRTLDVNERASGLRRLMKAVGPEPGTLKDEHDLEGKRDILIANDSLEPRTSMGCQGQLKSFLAWSGG